VEKVVLYYRVSTQRQGRSGLGLEAQQAAVHTFLAGQDAQVLREFTEIESGRKSDRPKLVEAVRLCRMTRAKLVIAKLDRLSRDAHFLLELEKSGVEFTAVDMPNANRMTVGVMALVAQQEAEAISARTKAALTARRARNLPLGNIASLRPADPAGAARARAAWSRKVRDHSEALRPIIQEMVTSGASLRAIARVLQESGYTTVRGGKWTATQVSSALRYADVGQVIEQAAE
jgi:DNA invertase Pin-like site-specific DNA recombinase